MTNKEFGNRLRELRLHQCCKECGRVWTQKELADASGINPGQINHYERGRRKPSMNNIIKLADALKIPADILWKEKT